MKIKIVAIVALLIVSANSVAADITGQAVTAEKQAYLESGGVDLWVMNECIPKWTLLQGGIDGVNMQQAANLMLANVGMCKCLGEAHNLGDPALARAMEMIVNGHPGDVGKILSPQKISQWRTVQMDPCLQQETRLVSTGSV
jgi:hypothetical protein